VNNKKGLATTSFLLLSISPLMMAFSAYTQIIHCCDYAQAQDKHWDIYHDNTAFFVFCRNITYGTVCGVLGANIGINRFDTDLIYYNAAMRNGKNAIQITCETRIEIYMHIQWKGRFQKFFRTFLAYEIASECRTCVCDPGTQAILFHCIWA
jgi:hypothetical protein